MSAAEPLPREDYYGFPNEETCDFRGASRLKAMIETYWAERGYSVQIMLHNAGFHPAIRSGRFDIRSTMRNGLPVSALPSPEHDND